MTATLVIPETARQEIFERGDKLYMTAPLQVFKPSDQQVEELAFAKQLQKQAPNENIVWLRGQYVEADQANLNGAEWTAGELKIKSLTPVLMPVTVMHDPRTAVGTIAEAKLLTPSKDGVTRARIETILALWGHRFPEAVQEAVENANAGTLMQSMECFSPWYECSECSALFHKLPGGAERANWCSHLRASNASGGFLDSPPMPGMGGGGQQANASRILGDVTFTGTGLIYGSRGAKGAYTEAHLEVYQDELAAFHQTAHASTSPATSIPIVTTASGGTRNMGLVQIEQSELDTLRKERDDARSETAAEKQKVTEAERKVEETEAKVTKAEEEKAAAVKERDELKETAAQAELKEKRIGALGSGFTAKLKENTRANLERDAKSMDDTAWEARLVELEEVAEVKRDAKLDGNGGGGNGGGNAAAEEAAKNGGGNGGGGGGSDADTTFTDEEVAAFTGGGGGDGGAKLLTTPTSQRQTVQSLGSLFKPTGK